MIGLASSLNRKVGIVVGVEAQAGVVEVVARGERRAPIDDPAFLRTKAVIAPPACVSRMSTRLMNPGMETKPGLMSL